MFTPVWQFLALSEDSWLKFLDRVRSRRTDRKFRHVYFF